MDPTRSREERSRGIAPASRWAWNARLIPGFLLTQVALLLLFAGVEPTSLQGVPGSIGVLIAVTTALLCGPLAGALVALAGGFIFVSLVTDFGPGSPYSVILWVVAAGGAGVIAGRLRRSDEERARAIARERLAANQLHRLQAVTGSLASAMSPEDVATAVISTAMAALGADAGGLTVRTDDPATLKVLASSTDDPSLLGVWQEHSIERPLPATEIVRTGKPIFIETRRELLGRFPIVKRIERDQRFGAFAGVPVTLGDETLGALALGFTRDHMVPPEQRGLLTAVAHQAAIALQRIRFEEDERRARATAEQAEDRLRKLQSVTDAANAAVGLDDMLKSVLPLVMGAMLADGTSFLLLSEDGSELRVAAALGAEEEGVEPTPVPFGTGASGRIAATGRPLVIADLTPEDVINPALGNRRSYVGVPMRIGGKVAGVLHASSARPGVFDQDDADFLQSVSDSLAVTLDRGRLFDQRDRMATALERALLPMSLPSVPGFEVATMYRPSHFGDEVGGDFYDVFGDGDVWYLAIGDVCGKGPEAAAIMGMTRVALRSIAREDDGRPLAEVLEQLNGFLLDSELMGDRYCTVCIARIDVTGELATATTCLGGHPPPILVRADGQLAQLGRPGSLLGLFDEVTLHESTAELGPGDGLALYTDGITELSVERPDEGDRLLRVALRTACDEDAAGIVKTVERTLLEPRGELRDDAALVVAKRV